MKSVMLKFPERYTYHYISWKPVRIFFDWIKYIIREPRKSVS